MERDNAHGQDGSREPLPDMRDHDVLLVKTLGELSQLFGLADLVVVGNDRNIFEPASLGKPILYFGDQNSWKNNREALAALEREEGAMPFARFRLKTVLDDSSGIREMGSAALRAYALSKGKWLPEMREKVVDCLLPFVLFRAMYGMKEAIQQEPRSKYFEGPAALLDLAA